jgi:Protein of unknown function (DUF1488)
MGRATMPLQRYDDAYQPDLDGVKFRMANGRGDIIVYHVTHEALVDHGAQNGLTAANDDVEIFLRFRERIEQIASEKYDAGIAERIVKTADLTPLR